MDEDFKKSLAVEALSPGSWEPRDHGAKCDLCPFGGPERVVVPPKPPSSGKVRLIVVGEGPGRLELLKGQPFIGPSGALLDDSFRKAKLPLWRRDTFITNASLCARPDASDSERDEAAACCAPRLMKELAALPAEAPIVALGKPAARALLGINGIMKVRGFVWKVREITDAQLRTAHRAAEKAEISLKALKGRGPKERAERQEVKKEVDLLKLKAELLEGRAKLAGRTVLPSVHPAFVLRSPLWRPVLDTDLDRAIRWLSGNVKLLDSEVKYRVLKNASDLKKYLPKLGKIITHDIETTPLYGPNGEIIADSKDPFEAVVKCLGVSDGKQTFVIFPWRQSYVGEVSKCFKSRTVVGHNIKAYDEIALKKRGIKYGETKDSLVAFHSFASHFPQGLAFVVSLFCDSSPWKISFRQGVEGAEKGLSPAKMPVEDLVHYNACDCILNWHAWMAMQEDLEIERSVFEKDMQLAAMCQEMQMAGMGVDFERWRGLSRSLQRRANRFLRRMRKLVGKQTFNPYATRDLREALYYKFRAPVLNLTAKTGVPSTSALQLEALAQSRTRYGKLSRYILKYRGARGTRQRNIEGVFVSRDGRVHFAWKSFGTQNGRFSCRAQQMPRVANKKRPILEDRIRELYVPAKGKVYVYFDVKQAEMKFAAFLSQDENFIRIAMSKDIHASNAKLIWPEASKDIDEGKGAGPGLRSIAKQCSFAINYGSGEATIMQTLHKQGYTKVTLKQVRQLLFTLQREFKGHFKFVERNYKEACRTGHMRSPLWGRIRWIGWTPELSLCMNTPVQSVVADFVNERMLEMREKMPRGCQLIFQGHDSGCYECEEGEPERQMEELIRRTFEKPVRLNNGRELVLTIDLKKGKRLSEVS